jgi:hypothetical protein
MHPGSEWAETVSSKIWAAPVCQSSGKRLSMEVEWDDQCRLQVYLKELWQGLRSLTRRIHAYTKIEQG